MAFGCVCASPRHHFCNLHGTITAEKRARARQGLDPVSTDVAIPEEGEVEQYEPQMPATLFRSEDPAEILAHAVALADTLAPVIRKRKLFKKIGDKDHIFIEGWTLCGTMVGVFPVCVWTHSLPDGWEARVEARTRDGSIVGAAEAQCTRSEALWAKREDYALRSMAQTRAASKALRGPLGFIVHLAGFSPTPAEEMPQPGTVQHPEGEPVDDGKFPPDVEMPAPTTISENDRRRLRAIQKKHGVTDEQLKAIVLELAGVNSSKDIPKVRYDAIVAAVQGERPGFQVPESLR